MHRWSLEYEKPDKHTYDQQNSGPLKVMIDEARHI